MNNRDLSYLLNLDLQNRATVIDEGLVYSLESMIKRLMAIRKEIEAVRKQAGGTLPSEGLLVVGRDAFSRLEIGVQSCVVYDFDVARLSRKSK